MIISSALQHDQGTPIGSLLLVVFNSILEVFLLCLAGYILAGRGVLDKKTQKQLNRLNVFLFTPALLFSKVAFFLTPEKLRELWVIPIFFLVVTATSGLLAFALGWLFNLKRSQRSFAMAAAMFMNSNSLPIALMQSLVVSVPDLHWEDDDNKDAMLGRALTYLVMYSTLGMILRWSYGVRLLSNADPEVKDLNVDERTPLLGEFCHDSDSSHLRTSTSECSLGGDDDPKSFHPKSRATTGSIRPLPLRRTTTAFYNSFPNSPNRSRANLDQYDARASPDHQHDEDMELPRMNQSSGPSQAGTLKRRILLAWAAFNDFMTVPLWASLASLVVAIIPPLQAWLQYRVQPVIGAVSSAGKCSIPVTLVVLGAYFYPHPPESPSSAAPAPPSMMSTTQPKTTSPLNFVGAIRGFFGHRSRTEDYAVPKRPSRKGETKTVIIAILSRMIFTPLALMPLIILSAKYDFHAVFEDPVFVVANVLLLASPPAVTLAQITQAASGDAFERLISRTIFWSYCIVTPPTTIIFVLLGLLLAKL